MAKLIAPTTYGKMADIGLLLLRLTFGGLMAINHGWPKLQKFFADDPVKFADPFGIGMSGSLGLAVFAELICGFLLVIGLFTRTAAVPLIITMLVAAFIIHGADPLAKKEMALLYLIPYIVLALTGAGQYSLDYILGKKQ